MISDDGMFTAEYVVPPALSIPLGTSGSSVDVRKNEDGTFSAMVGGEWMVITAETTVTAANGNVYAARLSPEGVPIGVMHVPAMQEVMLGEHGGTVTVKQAEDMTWWIGEMEVKTGTVYTAANGNMYELMLDMEGHWSAMYQKVMVTVALGTRGSITLVRAEDMSWWLGSEAVGVGSEVMSDNGNTYTLWYTDGAWSARFEPESMMIDGTGLTAMTREADDMYDVGDSTLPASGKGDVMDGAAMYHVWKQDGMLMGARFGKAIDKETDFTTKDLFRNDTSTDPTTDPVPTLNNLAAPVLSANDPDTAANEAMTHLLITGSAVDKNEAMFSMGDLLGSGMASAQGGRFVDKAVETIGKARADVAALLSLETEPTGLKGILDRQWMNINKALDTIFKTKSGKSGATNADSAVNRLSAPREEDILDEIDDILDALASEDAFVAATMKGGRGAFASQELSASAANDAFNRVMWNAMATLGSTGSTRYGTAIRKSTMYARDDLKTMEYGAFSYSTMQETARAADAAAVSLTGIASYSGGTEAISGSGKTYSGIMDLQVRFSAMSVSGVVKGLEDADGMPWRHNFAEVDRIVLNDARLMRNAQFSQMDGMTGTVFFTADSGLLRPVNNLENRFKGRLLGRGAAAGSEASGVWSVNKPGGSNYLTGGFGVRHVADAGRPLPEGDSGGSANAMIMSHEDAGDVESVSLKDGKLTVKLHKFGWMEKATPDANDPLTYGKLLEDKNSPKTPDDPSDDSPIPFTVEFDLETLAGKAAPAATTMNGPKHVDTVRAILQAQRSQLAALQGLGDRSDTMPAEVAAWKAVQNAVRYRLFGGNFDPDGDDGSSPSVSQLPVKLAGDYSTVKDDALNLIDRAIDALSSSASLLAALDPKGTGIFDHYYITMDDTSTETDETVLGDYITYDAAGDRRWETTGRNLPLSAFLGQREYRVIASLGTTSYTRFGIWRRESTQSAERQPQNWRRNEGGPGTFAYSPLDPTQAGSTTNPAFPAGGSARFMGETVALMYPNVVLTGTAKVDVSWASVSDTDALDLAVSATDTDSRAGTMTLTLSGLATAAGDPLTWTGGSNGPAAGYEIADIVFSNLVIEKGLKGDNSGHLIVGDEGTADTDGDYTYSEIDASSVRYRLGAVGMADQGATGGSDMSVKSIFVGQGVDGPLGVIGTWTLDDANVARVKADGSGVDAGGAAIYGSFGVDIP